MCCVCVCNSTCIVFSVRSRYKINQLMNINKINTNKWSHTWQTIVAPTMKITVIQIEITDTRQVRPGVVCQTHMQHTTYNIHINEEIYSLLSFDCIVLSNWIADCRLPVVLFGLKCVHLCCCLLLFTFFTVVQSHHTYNSFVHFDKLYFLLLFYFVFQFVCSTKLSF